MRPKTSVKMVNLSKETAARDVMSYKLTGGRKIGKQQSYYTVLDIDRRKKLDLREEEACMVKSF